MSEKTNAPKYAFSEASSEYDPNSDTYNDTFVRPLHQVDLLNSKLIRDYNKLGKEIDVNGQALHAMYRTKSTLESDLYKAKNNKKDNLIKQIDEVNKGINSIEYDINHLTTKKIKLNFRDTRLKYATEIFRILQADETLTISNLLKISDRIE